MNNNPLRNRFPRAGAGTGPKNTSALQILIAEGKREALLSALEAGIPASLVRHRDSEGITALHMAVNAGWTDAVAALVRAGADPLAADHLSRVPLHLAIEKDLADILRVFLHNGTSPDLETEPARMPLLHRAIIHDSRACVEILMDAGAKVLTRPFNAFHRAALCGRREILSLLLKHKDAQGVHDFCQHDQIEKDPLRIAALRSDKDMVVLLLEHGISINKKSMSGDTATHCLIRHRDDRETSAAILSLLIDHGADLDSAVNIWGETPLMVAAKTGHVEAVSVLLRAGCDPNQHGHDCETPLHAAAKNQGARTIGLLAKSGADLDAKDADGATPLHLAAGSTKRDAVLALLAAGADPLIKDAGGETPEKRCRGQHQRHILFPLIEAQKKWRFRHEQKRFAKTQGAKPPSKRP